MAATEQTALRKRQQITGANRTMFIWVAAASVLVGAAVVISVFLVQKLFFNEKVLSAKQHTVSVLNTNLSSIGKLKDAVRILNTDPSLKSAMTPDEQEPIQVVLDALPATANPTAVGASLQQKFLNDPALSVQSLTVDPVVGSDSTSTSSAQASTAGQYPITFHFTVTSGDVNALKTLLQNLERSIRTFDVTNVKLDVQSGTTSGYTLTVDGSAFYQPAVSPALKNTTISPKAGGK